MIPARRLAARAALTRRPWPAADADGSVTALSPDERATAAAIWHGRAEAELRASGSFLHLTVTLLAAGAAEDLAALAWRAVDDERRHAAICARVAAGFGCTAPLRRLPVTAPRHDGASPALRRVLHVVGMSALNETCGSAFLELCRAGARGASASAALHELLADEIDHARLGWAFVAAQPDAIRAALAAWLPRLLDGNLRAWRDRPRRAITPALIAQGCPTWDAVDAAIVAATRDLLVPGFDHAGVDTRAARAWLEGVS